MTGRAPTETPTRQCPSCGQEYAVSADRRCPHCDAELPPEYITSVDTTPYARATRRDRRARKQMRRWIYSAGPDRMRHLALVRSSPASHAFALRHRVLLIAAIVLHELLHVGWHRVVRTANNATVLAQSPDAPGWWRVLAQDIFPDSYGTVAVWWHPTRTAVAMIPIVFAALVGVLLMMAVLNLGARRVLASPYREEERLRAAIDYSFAWTHPIALAALIGVLLPAIDVLEVAEVGFVPPHFVVHAIQALLAGGALLMWWFWLVRLAGVLPQRARAGVTAYYSVGAPAIIAAMIVGWRIGMDRLYDFLWPLLDMSW